MSPFKSQAQRKYMWAKHPKIAKKWEKKTKKSLPEKLNDEMARRLRK